MEKTVPGKQELKRHLISTGAASTVGSDSSAPPETARDEGAWSLPRRRTEVWFVTKPRFVQPPPRTNAWRLPYCEFNILVGECQGLAPISARKGRHQILAKQGFFVTITPAACCASHFQPWTTWIADVNRWLSLGTTVPTIDRIDMMRLWRLPTFWFSVLAVLQCT